MVGCTLILSVLGDIELGEREAMKVVCGFCPVQGNYLVSSLHFDPLSLLRIPK